MARKTQYDPSEALQTQGPASLALDVALEYVRARGLRLVPVYLMAMAPISVIALFLIDAISAQHRSVIGTWCVALIPATLWRWAWLARMQQAVQQDLQAQTGPPLRSRLIPILLSRLYANVAISWGGFVVFPFFYGLFAGGFATPLFLEGEGTVISELVRVTGWIHHSASRLMRVTITLFLLILMLIIAAFLVQSVLTGLLLPSLLDVDSSELTVTFHSVAWGLTLLYFILLVFDFFWTVATVFLYHDSQSRRTGSDLRARLTMLRGREGKVP